MADGSTDSIVNPGRTVWQVLTAGGIPDAPKLRLAMVIDIEDEVRRCRRRMRAALDTMPDGPAKVDAMKSGYAAARVLAQTRHEQLDILYPPSAPPPMADDGFASALAMETEIQTMSREDTETVTDTDGTVTTTSTTVTATRSAVKRPDPLMRKAVTMEKRDEIRTMLDDGVPILRIQAATGISRPTIYSIKRELEAIEGR